MNNKKEMVQIGDSSVRKMYAKALIVIHRGYLPEKLRSANTKIQNSHFRFQLW